MGRLIEETGVNKLIDGILSLPLRLFEDERGWFAEIRRDSLLPNRSRRRTSRSRARA